MAKIETFEDLKDVVLHIKIEKGTIELSKILISCVNILHNERGGLGGRVSNNIKQVDYVDPSLKRLQNLDLSPNFRLLHWLENLDYNSVVIFSVDPLIYLRVLTSAKLLYHLISVLGPER